MHTPSGTRIGTANQGEARPGLSIVKLYVADYLLRHGDGSPEELALGQRMIRDSDDNAASQAYAKYPQSIDVIAAEYRLTSTRGSGFWGDAVTSTADTVTFLEAKKTIDPDSQILEWMATAAPRRRRRNPSELGHRAAAVGDRNQMGLVGLRAQCCRFCVVRA